MNWDQIEDNWQAMTRRIRPERPETTTPQLAAIPTAVDMGETAVDWPESTEISPVSAARMIA
ncbi:MAG: hypothetical protein II336_19710 [Loktanella sp.]|nr:hypothetical protein [Loktanella sp.]